jgi:F-type H+-transporting ATPase subunit b
MVAVAMWIQDGQEHGAGFDPFEFAWGSTFWTWAIFLLSLPFMWKFVFGPITRALADRDQRVVDAANAAEQAKADAVKAVDAARAEREHARAEARQMIQEATSRAERQGHEALRAAQAEAERQLEQVRSEIDAQKHKALLEIREEVVRLAIASAEKILKEKLDASTHERLVGEFLGSVESGST